MKHSGSIVCLIVLFVVCGSQAAYTGNYLNIDPDNEAYLRVLTRNQAYYDSATNAILLDHGSGQVANPGMYLTQIINKAKANLHLLQYAANTGNPADGPSCKAQAAADIAAIGVVISHENDTIPEAAANGGTILTGEPYYHWSLAANAQMFNPLVRLGDNNQNYVNPGKYLKIWIFVSGVLNNFAAWLAGNDQTLATCLAQTHQLGLAFQAFLVTVADPN